MKRILIAAIILFAFATTSHAQDAGRQFKKLKGNLSLGYGFFPGNSDIKNGFIFCLEPKFAVLDNLYIGARTEFVFLGRESRDQYGHNTGDIKAKLYGSFLPTTDFYFTNNYKLRPFAGAGAGAFLVSSTNSAYDSDYHNGEDGDNSAVRFGAMARIGIEIKHFRIGLEYNFVAKSTDKYTYYDSNSYSYITKSTEFKNSYFGFKAGFCFGGGPKGADTQHR